MKRYNCAFVFDGALSKRLVDFSQDNFANVADGYCLSDSVCPHITVAQFACDDRSKVQDMMYEIDGLSYDGVGFDFEAFAVRQGNNLNAGFQWVEFPIVKSKELETFHKDVIWIFKNYDIEPTSLIGDLYHPHVTLCRLPAQVSVPSVQVDAGFMGPYEDGVCLIFGESDECGQLLSLGV